MFLSNNLILKVNVHVNDINLNQKIVYYLMDNKIKNMSLKKSHLTLKNVKKNLLEKYKNEIEWIEITPNGYEYDVKLIERKKSNIKKSHERCNYVSRKSGTITRIKATKGVLLVQENNYVNQGDILISGNVVYNDELKSEVCANGKIYGEVWYEVTISYPMKKETIIKGKNKFYNISINLFGKKYTIFKNKYHSVEKLKQIGNDDFGIDVLVSSKNKKKKTIISEKEATKLALEKALKNIQLKTHNKSKILSQNILKKYINNGTIYMKVLITSEEELGVVESY